MPDTIILVHGLWMTGMELGLLRHRLEADHGFHCEMFSYASATGSMTEHLHQLRALVQETLEKQACRQLHFVGHSLGGVVCYKLFETTLNLPPGRAVLLGAPLQGSSAMAGLAQWSLGRAVVGDDARNELLPGQQRRWSGQREIGIIAGSSTLGLGRLFSTKMGEDSDGTVRIAETQLEGATDHIVLPVSHTSMVFSAEVAEQVVGFLRNGRFDHQGERI